MSTLVFEAFGKFSHYPREGQSVLLDLLAWHPDGLGGNMLFKKWLQTLYEQRWKEVQEGIAPVSSISQNI